MRTVHASLFCNSNETKKLACMVLYEIARPLHYTYRSNIHVENPIGEVRGVQPCTMHGPPFLQLRKASVALYEIAEYQG